MWPSAGARGDKVKKHPREAKEEEGWERKAPHIVHESSWKS